jgi:capsular exopolysaccharide synthesis family protein
LYVNSNNPTSSADLNDLNYAQKVVSTYINFLQTKVFYKLVIEESDLNYAPDQLKEMTKIQAINNTEIFQISVTTLDPDDSYLLVKTMQELAPQFIKNIKGTAELSVVDPAVLPSWPSGPNTRLNTIIGGMLGFLLSVFASFLWEIVDVKVKNQEDLAKKYHIPIMGAIPNYNSNKKRSDMITKYIPIFKNHFKKRKNKITKSKINQNKNNQNRNTQNKITQNNNTPYKNTLNNNTQNKNNRASINEDTKFVIKEAYNSLRANLRFALRKEGCKKIIISSPIPEDGKSTTSTNLAITIAQTGAKVLLMDCDLRKGRLHSFFNIKSTPGISDIISGMYSEKDVLQNTSHENLQIITMGAIPPNPTEILASVQMEELMKRLEKIFDYIIIDSPPVNVVSDALSLVKLVDGVVIVVREGATTHPHIVSALNKYKLAEANLLGFVLNGVSINQGSKSKSRYYYYHYKND